MPSWSNLLSIVPPARAQAFNTWAVLGDTSYGNHNKNYPELFLLAERLVHLRDVSRSCTEIRQLAHRVLRSENRWLYIFNPLKFGVWFSLERWLIFYINFQIISFKEAISVYFDFLLLYSQKLNEFLIENRFLPYIVETEKKTHKHHSLADTDNKNWWWEWRGDHLTPFCEFSGKKHF
jgi:hypothetical protein